MSPRAAKRLARLLVRRIVRGDDDAQALLPEVLPYTAIGNGPIGGGGHGDADLMAEELALAVAGRYNSVWPGGPGSYPSRGAAIDEPWRRESNLWLAIGNTARFLGLDESTIDAAQRRARLALAKRTGGR